MLDTILLIQFPHLYHETQTVAQCHPSFHFALQGHSHFVFSFLFCRGATFANIMLMILGCVMFVQASGEIISVTVCRVTVARKIYSLGCTA